MVIEQQIFVYVCLQYNVVQGVYFCLTTIINETVCKNGGIDCESFTQKLLNGFRCNLVHK